MQSYEPVAKQSKFLTQLSKMGNRIAVWALTYCVKNGGILDVSHGHVSRCCQSVTNKIGNLDEKSVPFELADLWHDTKLSRLDFIDKYTVDNSKSSEKALCFDLSEWQRIYQSSIGVSRFSLVSQSKFIVTFDIAVIVYSIIKRTVIALHRKQRPSHNWSVCGKRVEAIS